MSTVTFENGKSVQFQGTPTQADIDEVAAQMQQGTPGVQNHTFGESVDKLKQIGSGAAKLADMTTGAFTDVAAAPVQFLAKITGQQDPFANNALPNLSGTGATVNPLTVQGITQKLGHAAEIALLPATGGVSSVGGMALIGGAQGLAQSTAAGNLTNNPGQALKDTIYGTMFGTALGLGGKFLHYMGGMEQAKTGVTGAVKDAIDQTDPALLDSYIGAAKNHGDTMAQLAEPTPVALAENEFDKRASLLTDQVIPDAGAAVGAAKKAARGLEVGLTDAATGAKIPGEEAVNTITDNVNTALQDMTGHQFSSYASPEDTGLQILNYKEGASSGGLAIGDTGVESLPGHSVQLSSAEQKQLERLGQQLATLKDSPTVGTASDVLTNINTDIGKWNTPELGQGNSPVQGALKYAYGQVRSLISDVSPELDQASSNYHELQNLKTALGAQAGKEGQSSALMMRRVLSGDKSNSVIPLLNQLDAAVQPFMKGDTTSLVQHSILSNWATNMFGDESTKQLLAKAFSEGNKLSGESSSVFGYPRQFMKYLINGAMSAISPDPAAFAQAVASGKPFSLNPLVRFIDSQMTKTTNIPVIGAFTKGLQDLGVSATNAEPAAKTLFKIFLMQQLTRTQQFTPPTGAPQTLPVGKTLSF